MRTDDGRKTNLAHWDRIYARADRLRPAPTLSINTQNFRRLIRPHVRRGTRILEIGCAPGRLLALAATMAQSPVAGLDYSLTGLEASRRLFSALKLEADLRREDVFYTSFAPGSFDLVYSLGVIEHFEDPRAIVKRHIDLVAPGGSAVITVPNYRGPYGWVQTRFDAENLKIHNLDIMTVEAMRSLAPADLGLRVRAYRFGRLAPSFISWHARWPKPLAFLTRLVLNSAGMLQPFDLPWFCPWVVLELRKAGAATGTHSLA
jgi:2-polyprenyl-3-methyl-5-hydroxy-6-metoxy-1,4-benzoquinol methylase